MVYTCSNAGAQPPDEQAHRRHVVLHLVDLQDAVADHLRLGAGRGGKDEARPRRGDQAVMEV